MKKMLKKYPETFLTLLAVLFLGLIIGYFVWGVGDIVGAINRAMNANGVAGTSSGFDLKSAQSLDLRGLVAQ